MKRIINQLALFSALAVFLLFTSCKKLKDLTFDYNAAAVIIDLPAYTTAGNISAQNTVSDNQFKNLLDDKGVSLDNLKSVSVKSMHVELIDTAAAPVTFDVLDYLYGEIAASGLPQVQYASITDPSGTSIDLTTDKSVNVVEYLKTGNYSYGVMGHNNAPINHPTKLKVTAVFEITGSIKK